MNSFIARRSWKCYHFCNISYFQQICWWKVTLGASAVLPDAKCKLSRRSRLWFYLILNSIYSVSASVLLLQNVILNAIIELNFSQPTLLFIADHSFILRLRFKFNNTFFKNFLFVNTNSVFTLPGIFIFKIIFKFDKIK